MNKKILGIFTIIVVIVAVYWFLGILGFVPILHCDSATGPNGVVNFCEWYGGAPRVY